MDWALACEPKGHQFNSWSGHMSGLWDRSPVRGAWEATAHCCFSFSPPLSQNLFLKKNNLLKIQILGPQTNLLNQTWKGYSDSKFDNCFRSKMQILNQLVLLRLSVPSSVNFCNEGNLSIDRVTTSHIELLRIWNVGSATEKLNFNNSIYLVTDRWRNFMAHSWKKKVH